MHQQISKGNMQIQLLKTLVQMNWIRTIIWTLLFVLSAASDILKSL